MPIRDGTVNRRRALYEEAVEIIEREYASDLELDSVARRLATSRRQLQRAFAEAGDTSFRSQLAQVRMRRALDLLREGSLPVREVAGRVQLPAREPPRGRHRRGRSLPRQRARRGAGRRPLVLPSVGLARSASDRL